MPIHYNIAASKTRACSAAGADHNRIGGGFLNRRDHMNYYKLSLSALVGAVNMITIISCYHDNDTNVTGSDGRFYLRLKCIIAAIGD